MQLKTKDLQALLIEMEPLGGLVLEQNWSDAKNSNRNVISVGPGGVGLPDRDYYVSEDADSKKKETCFTLLKC
jgi:endothelin-converting enzyme/putative endopeptidase